MESFGSSASLAPRRRGSLHFKQRPKTAYGPEDIAATLPRSKTTRWSMGPGAYDVLDWRSFKPNQEHEGIRAVTPVVSDVSANRTSDHFDPETTPRPEPYPRRASNLAESLRSGFSGLRFLGRKLSVTVRGKSKQKEDVHETRPLVAPLKSEDRLMDFNEAITSRPKSRGWMLRSPSTRRRPSMPALNFITDPWTLQEQEQSSQTRPSTRGQPVLSDLVFGGAGARASAAAQNEIWNAIKTPPLPPYEPPESDNQYRSDSESGIGITISADSRRGSAVAEPFPAYRDPASVLATELVELIFSYLDAGSLLDAGIVSRQWRQVSRSQAIWRLVFLRQFAVKQPNPFLCTSGTPGLGKNTPGQDYRKLYQVRTMINKRWDAGQAAAIYLNGHRDSVYCVQFDESKIITGSRDNTIRVWDAHTYQCLRKLGPPNNARERHRMEKPAVEPRGTTPFFQADVTSPDPIDHASVSHWHQASVLCLQYDDEILVSGSSDFTCLVWSIKDNYQPLFRLIGHQAGVLDVCLDGRYIVTCSKDATIKKWDRRTGRLLQTLTGHRGPVNAVQIRGNLLVSASGDSRSKLWRLEDGLCIKEFQSKDRGLACVEFSEDGRTIFAGGNDQVIYEYDTVTGQRIRELKGHGDLVRSLHLDSANNRIISGSYDHSIKVWDAKRGEGADDGGMKISFEGWTSSWMLAAKSNYRKIVCTSQDGRVVIIDFGYGIDGVDLVEA